MKSILQWSIYTLLLSFVFMLNCSPVEKETAPEEEPTILLLSLEETGRTSAEFSGTPVPAIVELDVDTFFNVLDWHTGQGHPVFEDSIVYKKALRFSVMLTWNKYPLLKDSATGLLIDTVYVSIGGSLKKSNKVFVKVTNLPVVIDSASFNSMIFKGKETDWQYVFSDTSNMTLRFPLRIYAHDFDNKLLSLQVLGPKHGTITHTTFNSMEMEYEPPSGDFIDTVSFIVYDQQGGQALRQLKLVYTAPNIIPIIDSVQVQSSMLRGTGTYEVAFKKLDSLKFRLFAHDSLGSIKKVTWRSNNYIITTDSSNEMMAIWSCTKNNCPDGIVDSSYVIDTITIKVTDNRNDSTRKVVRLHYGTINEKPVITSILFNTTKVQFNDSLGVVTAAGSTAYMLELSVSDPEDDSLHIIWNSYPASRLSEKTDSTVRYFAPSLRDTDTVFVSISDGKTNITRYIRILINDIAPVLDSILIADTLVKNPNTLVYYPVSAHDTLLLIAYAQDFDDEDTLQFQWTAGKTDRFTARVMNRAKYVLPASDLNDTINLTLQDGTVTLDRKIILTPAE